MDPRIRRIIEIVVLVFAAIGLATVLDAAFAGSDPVSDLSGAGQIAVFIGVLIAIWFAERLWKAERRK